ncbi:MAG: hypothetical protein ACYCPH_02420, partial [Minisyncoccota bacterium]
MFELGAGRLDGAMVDVMSRSSAAISAAARGVMRMFNCVSAARGAGAKAKASSINATRTAEWRDPAREFSRSLPSPFQAGRTDPSFRFIKNS